MIVNLYENTEIQHSNAIDWLHSIVNDIDYYINYRAGYIPVPEEYYSVFFLEQVPFTKYDYTKESNTNVFKKVQEELKKYNISVKSQYMFKHNEEGKNSYVYWELIFTKSN